MPNTANVRLPMLSQKIYKEWLAETILVQSCDNSFEGEFDIANREIDIPVYHDLSIHQTTIKEHELKPAPIEFVRTSTKRVTIDKGRYSHWGETNIGKLINKLTANTGEIRTRLVKKWALAADIELATFCAKLPRKQEIDLITLLTDEDANPNGVLTPENVVKAFDILKAHVTSKNMTVSDFKLFASERLEGILRDAKIVLGSNLDANEAFKKVLSLMLTELMSASMRLLKLLLVILIPNLLRRSGRFGKPEMGFNMLFLIRTLFSMIFPRPKS